MVGQRVATALLANSVRLWVNRLHEVGIASNRDQHAAVNVPNFVHARHTRVCNNFSGEVTFWSQTLKVWIDDWGVKS